MLAYKQIVSIASYVYASDVQFVCLIKKHHRNFLLAVLLRGSVRGALGFARALFCVVHTSSFSFF